MAKRTALIAVIALFAFVATQSLQAAAPVRASNNVTVTTQVNPENQDQELIIVGDAAANSLAIVDLGTTRYVIGLNKTTINNQSWASFTLNDTNQNDIFIDLAGGNDTVLVLTANTLDQFVAEGGAGNDTIHVFGTLNVQSGINLDGFETILPPDLVP
jgi:hypothetical protein